MPSTKVSGQVVRARGWRGGVVVGGCDTSGNSSPEVMRAGKARISKKMGFRTSKAGA